MGDYGFEGAGDFGGQDTNFNCLPDYDSTRCPNRKSGLFGDDWTDTRLACELTAEPDADGRGFGHDECKFIGSDYRKCSIYVTAEKLKQASTQSSGEVKGFTKNDRITAEDVRNISLESFFYDSVKCPERKRGLVGANPNNMAIACNLTECSSECKFCGNDYRRCTRYDLKHREVPLYTRGPAHDLNPGMG